MDHKFLIYSLQTTSDKYLPREICHLDFMAQYSSNSWHISGNDNVIADAKCSLSRLVIPMGLLLWTLEQEDKSFQQWQTDIFTRIG